MAGAIVPIFGIRRNAQKARRVGQKLLLGILASLRNPEMGKVSYNKVKDLRFLERGAETDSPAWEP